MGSRLMRKPGFEPRLIYLGLAMKENARDEVFFPAVQFSPVSVIPPLFHTHPLMYDPPYIVTGGIIKRRASIMCSPKPQAVSLSVQTAHIAHQAPELI